MSLTRQSNLNSDKRVDDDANEAGNSVFDNIVIYESDIDYGAANIFAL